MNQGTVAPPTKETANTGHPLRILTLQFLGKPYERRVNTAPSEGKEVKCTYRGVSYTAILPRREAPVAPNKGVAGRYRGVYYII